MVKNREEDQVVELFAFQRLILTGGVDFVLRLDKMKLFLQAQLRNPRTWVFLAALLTITILLFFGRVNNLRATNAWHGDEFHSVQQGVDSFHSRKISNWRALEGSRWLVRLFYPYALVKTLQDTGGIPAGEKDGWQKVGHYYIASHFSYLRAHQNPVMRRFFFHLRIQNVALVAGSFLVLSILLIRYGYYVSAIGIPLISGVSLDLLTQQAFFYIEPSMIAWVNVLLTWILYSIWNPTRTISRKECWTIAFFSAFGLSLKLSLLFFVASPLIVFFLCKNDQAPLMRSVGHWIPGFVISLGAINILAVRNMNQMIHDITSNFWQYANNARPAGWDHFRFFLRVMEGDMGYLVYAIPFLLIMALFFAGTAEKKYLSLVLGMLLLTIAGLVSQNLWTARNFVPLISSVSLLALFPTDILSRYWKRKYLLQGRIASVGLITLLAVGVVAGIHFANEWSVLKKLNPDYRTGLLERIQALESHKVLPRIRPLKDAKVLCINSQFPSLADNTIAESDFPSYFELYYWKYIAEATKLVENYDVVIVKEFGNRQRPENNQLVRYLLPKLYPNSEQCGDYHVFYKTIRDEDLDRSD